ncbi:MAG: ABC transporter permease [Pelolinea sp.]|nr:ABC transporter permease [Pelolinea sp.]
MKNKRFRKIFDAILIPALAIISGLLLMAILIAITGQPILESYKILLQKGFGCEKIGNCAILSTLERATPMILTGLSAVVAFRSGMFSIGQEGQYLMGSVVAAWLGYAIHLPSGVHQSVIIIASMLAGALYGYIPGVLKVRLGVNELLATIVLNTIAMLFTEYMVQFPLRGDKSTTAHSPIIDETAELMTFLPGSKWGVGFIIAIVAVVVIFIYLWKTKSGYEQRMAGQATRFALYGGVPSKKAAIRAMIISGALAGLAGSIEVLGVHRRLMTGFSVGLGFDGLTAAILGQSHPFGVLIVSILFAGVKLGAQLGLQLKLGIPRELGGTIIGFIILFVAARKFYENNIERIRGWFKSRGHKKAKGEGN